MFRLDAVPAESREALANAGFRWEALSGMWLNLGSGRAISFETVRDHDWAWLRHWLAEGSTDRGP